VRTEREITDPVELCTPDGRLNPAAVGWTRVPLHTANLRRWGRTKRWEYWGIVTPTHVVGLTVSSLDYAGVHGLYVLDRTTAAEVVRDVVVPFARGVVLPTRSAGGPARARAKDLTLALDETSEGTRLRASAPGVEVDVLALRPDGHESLGVVVPWSRRLFQYTVKDVARPASGRLVLHGVTHPLAADSSFAVLDHGRGRWPYSITWNWGAGFGTLAGRTVGIQVGGKWTDGTGSTENGLFVDGRLHKISDELGWDYDRSDWKRPWSITGQRLDLRFDPFHERVARTNLGVVAAETHQCFGHYTGWASTDDGERVSLDGVVGWAEEARNRW
jgi:hypothetical protein